MSARTPLLVYARDVVERRRVEKGAKGIEERARELPRERGFEMNALILWVCQSQRVSTCRL